MKIYRLVYLLLFALFLTACNRYSVNNSEENITTSVYLESVENVTSKNFIDENIHYIIEKKKKELDLSDEPFGVSSIYIGSMFDYNNDGYEDFVLLYALYAQFEFVIIDSQNADILFDDRIMMDLFSKTKIELYLDNNLKYAFKISDQIAKPQVSHIIETIQIINSCETCILEAVYDYDTNSFSHGYDNYYNKYNYEEYVKKQEELLFDYNYYMNLEFEIYT